MKIAFLHTPKASDYSFYLFVCVQEYLTNMIYMYINNLLIKLTFGALLTLGVCVIIMSRGISKPCIYLDRSV